MPVLKLWHHFIAIIVNSTTYCGSPAGYVHPKNLVIQIVFMQRQFHWRRIKKLNIVCRLGGFHLLMSFLGSIGTLMKGSGIEELQGEIYAANVIQHIISGKEDARALPGQILVKAALIQHMTGDLLKCEIITIVGFGISQFKKSEDIKNPDLENLLLIFNAAVEAGK